MAEQALKIETLLEQVVKQDASDLHLTVGVPPMLRVDGALKPFPNIQPLTEQEVEKLVFSVVDDIQKEILITLPWAILKKLKNNLV